MAERRPTSGMRLLEREKGRRDDMEGCAGGISSVLRVHEVERGRDMSKYTGKMYPERWWKARKGMTRAHFFRTNEADRPLCAVRKHRGEDTWEERDDLKMCKLCCSILEAERGLVAVRPSGVRNLG